MAEEAPESVDRGGPRVGDLAGLVVGFGVASLLARAYVPLDAISRGPAYLGCLFLIYVWMGTALSGPILLTLDRARRDRLEDGTRLPPMRHTRAELSWILIGSYWFVMAACFAARRIPEAAWPIFFILPGIGLFSLVIGSFFRRPSRVTPPRAWTHLTAVGLLCTWPLVWVLLIVVSYAF